MKMKLITLLILNKTIKLEILDSDVIMWHLQARLDDCTRWVAVGTLAARTVSVSY